MTLLRFIRAYRRWRQICMPVGESVRLAWWAANHPRVRQ